MSVLLTDTLSSTKNKLVGILFTGNESTTVKQLTKKISNEMKDLMFALNSCDVHFIRNIKPNDFKRENLLI